MKHLPDINISIRYKIIGAFLLSAMTPWILLFFGFRTTTSIVIGLAISILFGWYSSFRIFSTISILKQLARRLIPTSLKKTRPFRDELTNLYYAFDLFLEKVNEDKQSDLKKTVSKVPNIDLNARHVFHAELTTGESVCGEAGLLPNRNIEELWVHFKQEGNSGHEMFQELLNEVSKELDIFLEAPELDQQTKDIIEFQVLLLNDVLFLDGISQYLDSGLNLTEAFNTIFAVFTTKLEQSNNIYMKARINDLNDLKQRFFQCMARMNDPYASESYANLKDKIILCDQIFPSEIILLKNVGIKGIISLSGTAASHAEILLESFGIPSASCIDDMPIHLMEGKKLLIDTVRKKVVLNYTSSDEKSLGKSVSPNKKIIREEVKLKSGEKLWVGATINNPYLEAPQASRVGADGIGLFRTEIGFIGHTTLPTEEELYLEYQHLFLTFSNREIYIRLLDLGSDKLAFFQENKTKEENPCMGNRSTRLLIHRPDILRTQLRAIIRAAAMDTTIILPMISGWTELIQIKKISEGILAELKTEGVEKDIKWGLMVEVPALVEKFETIVEHFDSFNIGSNDLTQYTLAVDRNNKDVAEYYRYSHPAILSMLFKLVQLCKEKHKKLILCGEMSSRVELLPLIIGLGIRNFSVPYKKIIDVKTRLMELDFHTCQGLAKKALKLSTPDEIETLLV